MEMWFYSKWHCRRRRFRPLCVSLLSTMLNRGEIPRPWYACNIRYPQDFGNFVYFGAIISIKGTNFVLLKKNTVCFEELFFFSFNLIVLWHLRSRVWIAVQPTKNDSTRLYKNGDISVVISCSSNLIGRKSKCYFIIKFSYLLSTRLWWREVRPDAGKTTETGWLTPFNLTVGNSNWTNEWNVNMWEGKKYLDFAVFCLIKAMYNLVFYWNWLTDSVQFVG